MNKLTIVIPARNEEGTILKTLRILKDKVDISHNFIVIDDQSADATKKLVEKEIKKTKNLKIFSTSKSRNGFSSALKLGFSKCTTPYVVVVMADLCDDPRTISEMYKKILDYDIVCGSRYVKGGKKRGGPVLQNLFSKIVCKSLYYLGVPSTDISNAFKMYRKSVLKNVVFKPKSGVEASMEISLQAIFNGANVTDLPTSWKGRKVGKSKFKIIERGPKYLRIYSWTIMNLIRRKLGIEIIKY